MLQINWPLEIAKLLYMLVVSVVLFLFFTLLLDAFCLIAFGGWNPLLGSWPIFSGTVSSAIYSPTSSVVSLVTMLMILARVMLGKHTPSLLTFLDRQESDLSSEESTGTPTS